MDYNPSCHKHLNMFVLSSWFPSNSIEQTTNYYTFELLKLIMDRHILEIKNKISKTIGIFYKLIKATSGLESSYSFIL